MTEETNIEFNQGSSSEGQEQEQANAPAASDENASEQEAADKEQESEADASDKGQDSQGESEQNEKAEGEQEMVEINLPEDSIIEDKEGFLDILKDATTSQEGFDKLMEFVKENGEKAQEKIKEADEAAWQNTLQKWEGELKSDADFGKDYDANVKNAMEVADDIGLGDWLKETGFDKNPEVLKSMLKVHSERSDAAMRMGSRSETGHPKNPDGTHKIVFDTVKS